MFPDTTDASHVFLDDDGGLRLPTPFGKRFAFLDPLAPTLADTFDLIDAPLEFIDAPTELLSCI